MAKLDIIIPTYNATKTLARALASIYIQTIKDDVNVYVVNDCDEADYSDIIERWVRDLNLFYLQTPKNGGAGMARQYGLDKSDSKFVMFLDADDALASAFSCELLLHNAEEHNADMVCGAFDNDFRQNGFAVGETETSTTWLHSKLFKREFLDKHSIRFREGLRSNEDCYFNQLFCSYEPKAISLKKVCYSWIYTNGSLTRTGESDNRFNILYDYIQAAETYIDECVKRGVTNNRQVLRLIADNLLIVYRYYNEIIDTCSEEMSKKYLDRCKEYYKNYLSLVPDALADELLTESNMVILRNVEFTSRIPTVSIPEFARLIMGS